MSRTELERLWWVGVNAVRGAASVRASLTSQPISPPNVILAVGKAAGSMALAAADLFPDAPMLVVTKYGHLDEMPNVADVIEAAHPVPDENSLKAGAALLDAVTAMGAGTHLLLLVSGGASALAECPAEGWTLEALRDENAQLLAAGLDIHAMNTRRREISRIKGGGLLAAFQGRQVTSLAISDVSGDDLGVIGSGIGSAPKGHRFDFDVRIVASNAIARAAIQKAATLSVVCNDECLYDDVEALAPRLAARLKEGPAGLYVFGGEPTVVLPENPGQGGRNQALALAISRELQGIAGIEVLVAGSDGTDGPTDAAGGFASGEIWQDEAASYLSAANAGPYLEKARALFRSGPTGTNVMDLIVAIKSA